MNFSFFLEYEEGAARAVQAYMETYFPPDQYEIDYEMGTLIIYTNDNPSYLEEDIYQETGRYAVNYGKV
jgi:hypothetical protein